MSEILSPAFLARLERLTLAARASVVSGRPGPRRAVARGDSIEFDDYRAYHPGDDLRHIDWTIYARLGKRFLRLFRAEAELTVHILLDTSRSMAFPSTGSGQEAADKLQYAIRAAATVAYVGLVNGDRVGLATFADGLLCVLPPRRGKPQLSHVFEALARASAEGSSRITPSLMDYANAAPRTGLALVISDAFAPDGCRDGLRYLAYRQFDVTLLHVLADEELDPPIEEDAEVVDLEDAARAPLPVDAGTLQAYRRVMADYASGLESFCAAEHIGYIRGRTSAPFDDLILRLVRAGLLRPHA